MEVKSERKVNHLRSNNIRQFGSIVAQFESSNQITHNNSISNLRRDIKEETTKLSQNDKIDNLEYDFFSRNDLKKKHV